MRNPAKSALRRFRQRFTSFAYLLGAALALMGFSDLRADTGVSIPTGTWTLILTRGVPASTNGWEQLVYVRPLKQSIMLSQYHQRNSEPNESLVGYNFDTNSWDVIDM